MAATVRRPFPGAQKFVPATRSLATLAAASRRCRGCDLYRFATQTVFGEGSRRAALFLVGEQPGDQEDRQGAPFVGPAGRVLDRAFAEAGIAREEVYVTNAVKHFKFEERGKRRIHKKPRVSEVVACLPWLEAELAAVRPRVVVAMGATARESLARERQEAGGRELPPVVETIHPSAVLRGPEHADRERLYAQFVRDLKKAREAARR
jgi:uracil-DNA glycosylase